MAQEGATDSLGAGRIDLVIDTSQYDVAIKRAKGYVADMSNAAQQQYAKLDKAERRRVDRMIHQANTVGLTRDQVLAYNAALRTEGQLLDDITRKIARNAALEPSSGLSDKARAAAMRGVPAQITDIAVSLQGGQNPMTVLFQQGGQLKDMFGGIVPAAKALGSTIAGLVTPFTVAAASVGVLAVAFQKGQAESEAYTQALITTGNYAGTSAAELASMAQNVAEAGGTVGKAAEVLTKLSGTGRITAGTMQSLAEAAIAWESATGQAIDETVKDYLKLAEEPSKASAELNRQYNYLTESVYAQIKALEDQGRTQDAANLAEQTYANALKDRSAQIKDNLGTLESAWSSLASMAKGAWDAMLNIGRPASLSELRDTAAALEQQLSTVEMASAFATNGGGAAFGRGAAGKVDAANSLKKRLAEVYDAINKAESDSFSNAAKGEAARLNQQKIAADQEIDTLVKSSRTKKQIREDEQRHYKQLLDKGVITQERYQAAVAAIEAKYKDPKTSGAKDDAATRLLAEYSQGHAALQAQLVTQEKLGTWERRRVEFEQQLADLKEKRILTADQKSIVLREAELRAALERNAADEAAIKLAQEKLKLSALSQSLTSQRAADQQGYDGELAVFGMGQQARERQQAQLRLYRDYQRDMGRLAEQRTKGSISNTLYQQETQAYQDNLKQRLAMLRAHYAQVDALQSNWVVGATAGLQDYADGARNIADSTGEAFQTMFTGLENFGTEAITTLKLNFKSLGTTAIGVLQDIARQVVRQNVTGPAASWLSTALNGLLGGITAGSGYVSAGSASGGIGGMSGSWGAVLGGRATGGPTVAGGLYEVNERGRPELYTEGSKTYLMAGSLGGQVTPMSRAVGSAERGVPNIKIENNFAAGVEVQARMSDDDIIFEINQRIAAQTPQIMDRQAANPNSRFSRQMSRSTNVQRSR